MATQRQLDPTQTLSLRRRYAGAIGRRLAIISRAVQATVGNRDALGLSTPIRTESSDATVARFLLWLQGRIDESLLELTDAAGNRLRDQSVWQEPFIDQGYVRGLAHADAQLALPLESTGTTIRGSLQSPTHVNRLELLYTRSFSGVPADPTKPGLLNLSETLRAELADELTLGLAEGQGPRQVGDRISKRIRQINRVSGRRIARTQIIGAHADGTLTRFQEAGQVNVSPLAEFSTAGDARVCQTCLSIETTDRFGLGPGIFPVSQSFGVIPVHPNCRCAWLPAGIGEDTTNRTVKVRRSRGRLRDLQTSRTARREQRLASTGAQ